MDVVGKACHNDKDRLRLEKVVDQRRKVMNKYTVRRINVNKLVMLAVMKCQFVCEYLFYFLSQKAIVDNKTMSFDVEFQKSWEISIRYHQHIPVCI
jgi:hypothetical protein